MKIKKRYIVLICALICVLIAISAFLVYFFCIRFDAGKVYNEIDLTKFEEKYPDYSVDFISVADSFYLGRMEEIEIKKEYTKADYRGYMNITYGHNFTTSDITYDISIDLRAKNTGEQVAKGKKTGQEDCYFAKFDYKSKTLLSQWGYWTPPDMTREEFNAQQLEMMDYALGGTK